MSFLRRPMPSAIAAVALTAAIAYALEAAAQEIVATPMLPAYGEAVAIDLRDANWPMYLPATRYRRTGSVNENGRVRGRSHRVVAGLRVPCAPTPG